jgi:hypothetical protein
VNNSATSLQIFSETDLATEIDQRDEYTGEIISKDNQTRYCVYLPIRCNSSSGDINVGMTIKIDVEIERLSKIPNQPEQKRRVVAYHGAMQVKTMLERVDNWDIYKSKNVTLYGTEPLSDPNSSEIKMNAQISDLLTNHFREATKRNEEIKDTIEKAKSYLDKGLDYAFHDGRRLSNAARFISNCMRAGSSGNMDSWNHEKAHRLLSAVDELVKRKNPNHPNYKSKVETIRGILYLVECPEFWDGYPPQPHLLDIK